MFVYKIKNSCLTMTGRQPEAKSMVLELGSHPGFKSQLHHSLNLNVCVCVCSVIYSCLTLCDPMTVSCQAPLFMGFPRQKF